MELGQEVLRQTNGELKYNELRESPPAPVKAALLALMPPGPEELVTMGREAQESTSWEVWALSRGLLVHLVATRRATQWFGGDRRDQQEEHELHAVARKLTEIASIGVSKVRVANVMESDWETRSCWEVTFNDGAMVTLDAVSAVGAEAESLERLGATISAHWRPGG